MENNIKIKRALVSVFDKSNIVELAKTLKKHGCEIISTGGTAKKLKEEGIDITDISDVTGNPEAFGGRMKTISFNIESALLFDRDKDNEEAKKLNIKPIDMVVCNLYPFKEVAKKNSELDVLIENIDIGGPTMIRAGAKNFKYVSVLTDTNDYDGIINELNNHEGNLSYDTRKKLMRKAFNHTADYDSFIASTMDKLDGEESLRFHFNKGKKLRYGENSHQKGFYFRDAENHDTLYDMEVFHGKELSFNNIMDINGAIESVSEMDQIACAVVKHTNPCGLCQGNDQRKVFELAWNGDPVSAYGSIIAFNTKLEKDTAEFLQLDNEDKSKRKFVEVIIAPDFTDECLDYLKQHKNIRIIRFDSKSLHIDKDIRFMNGSLLLQDKDNKLYDKLNCVTEKNMDAQKNIDLIEFGLKAMKNIKSNSILLVRRVNDCLQLLGMGSGQPNRLISSKIALDKSNENLMAEYNGDPENVSEYIQEEMGKSLLVSDAFFPFSDNIILADQYNIKQIIQPGGSIRDKSVIAKCNECGISMIFTGIRHFKH